MMSLKATCLFLIFLTCFHTSIKADLPVHCYKHQVLGKWKFELTEPLKGKDFTCGHDVPDRPDSSYLAMMETFEATKTFSLELKDSNEVHKEGSVSGKWSMIYDEGLAVKLDDVHYVNFFKYYDELGSYKSDCSKTLVGWYEDKINGERGCFKGYRTDVKDQSEVINDDVEHLYIVQPDSLIEKSTSGDLDKKPEYESDIDFHENFKEHDKVVERLNSDKVSKSWEAGVHKSFVDLSIKQLNKRAGRQKMYVPNQKQPMLIQKKDDSSNTKFKNYAAQDISDLPSSFDWREYLRTPKSQGDCGSCYTFATLSMLEARLKIKYHEDVQLSVQYSIDCNFYNQGCDGGYPYLVETWAQQYDLVPEHCHPYTAKTGHCSNSCSSAELEKTYKVKDFGFVGGEYGKSNERNMMLEIKNNGPIVVSFEPTYDFMYYKSGIYHSVPAASWIMEHETRPEWEKVDHSVLCYGWGEENGEKYWMIQNTWGTDWGEGGFFRMRRGTDESSIESMAEMATPVVNQKSTSYSFLQKNKSAKGMKKK